MADVITRLKLESGEYDSKVKRATQGLLQMEQECRNAGKSLATLEKEQKQYVQSLGSMQTVSTTVRGKLGELTQAYTELRVQYNRLTEEEKKGDFGKALSSSLDQLNQRIQQTKKELSDVNKELSGMDKLEAGGLFGGSKISGMLQVFGGNVMTKVAGMATGLVTEMGDAIKQGVELARQGEGIRIAFERLGRGDILDGLREATHGTVTDLELMKAAVKFNDFKLPVEELGTMLAFAQQKAKDTGQSVDYMVDSIVTGLGRKSLMILDNLGLSAAEIKERMKETGDMTKAVGAIIRDQMAKSGDYIETAADRATKADVELKNAMEELGRTFQPLADAGTSMWTALETGALKFISRIGEVIAQLTEAGRVAAQYGEIGGSDRVGSQLTAYRGAKDKDSYRKAVLASYDAQIRQREQVLAGIEAWRSGDRSDANRAAFDKMEQYGVGRGDNAALRAQINALRKQRDEFSRGAVESTVSPITNPNGPKKETKKELTELQQNQQKINDLTQEYVKLGDESTEAARERQAEIQKEIELLKERNGLLGLRAEQAQGRFLVGAGDFQKSGLSNNPGTLLSTPNTSVSGLMLDDKAMNAVNKQLEAMGHEVVDFGTYDENAADLPDYVYPAALSVAKGECDRGIFVDGVGYGSAMIANKVNGIYAAVGKAQIKHILCSGILSPVVFIFTRFFVINKEAFATSPGFFIESSMLIISHLLNDSNSTLYLRPNCFFPLPFSQGLISIIPLISLRMALSALRPSGIIQTRGESIAKIPLFSFGSR